MKSLINFQAADRAGCYTCRKREAPDSGGSGRGHQHGHVPAKMSHGHGPGHGHYGHYYGWGGHQGSQHHLPPTPAVNKG